MQKNLVIVESPAKAKTIEKFLGKDYKVMSSYGHVRDLQKKGLGLDAETLAPHYEIPAEKAKVVSDLMSAVKKAKTVWLASDEDREGEAISWHLCEVLGLDEKTTKRIVFHEITLPAITAAIKEPRSIDMNLVNAQQARRVLDRIVGFKLSPVLWRKVKPALSAGRVQSVAVRCVVEREREIQSFTSERYFKVTASFPVGTAAVKAELNVHFKTEDEVTAFLKDCDGRVFHVSAITKKPLKRSPAPPFTTSTLQQEAARKLGLPVSRTMMIAQRLYENGYITYMRTDSVNLSKLCLAASKETIAKLYGDEYSQPRQYKTRSKGAQEAHEAIRPTDMNVQKIDGTAQDKRLYELIWKRTIASQMTDAKIEKTTVTIDGGDSTRQFVATGEVVKFNGFLKVYRESSGDDKEEDESAHTLPSMQEGQSLTADEITGMERHSAAPMRYNEASLVHKLEELGIGRPSTYAPIISTIQQRGYVVKGDKSGTERTYVSLTLKDGNICRKTNTETTGSDKGKLLPTDVGIVVNDFLTEFFPNIMDYNFTANVEREFDDIAEGKKEWTEVMRDFYAHFEPVVEDVINVRSEHKTGEREIGTDPATGRKVYVKIGRYGPVVQIGTAGEDEKPRFARLPAEKSMETITLSEALDMLKLPRAIGEYEDAPVTAGTGRFGAYVLHKGKYVSIPKDKDPLTVTLDEAVALIEAKRDQEKKKHIKTFDGEQKIEILNGRFGPYLTCDGTNYRIPKEMRERAAELTLEECKNIMASTDINKKSKKK